MSLLESYSEICRDGTFGPAVPRIAVCRGGFDFTGPACLLFVTLPWRLLSLWGRKCKTKRSWLHEIKLTGFATLGVLQALLLALSSRSQVGYRAVLISSATLQLCASILLAVLSHWEHRNAIRPSFLISAFLFLTSILDAARARTQALIEGQHIVASTLIAIIVAKLLLLLIESQEKTRILLPEYSETSSELRSSLFSRAFFTWLLPVLSAGFKGVISFEDLPAVNEKLSSEALTARVESKWKKGISKGPLALMFDVLLSFPKEFSIVLVSNAIQVGLQICQPSLTQKLVRFLESPTAPMNVGYGLLGGFFCVSILNALSEIPDRTTTATSSSSDSNVSVTREKSAERDRIFPVHDPQQPHGHNVAGNGPFAAPALCFTPNCLTAITGPVGCGKSTVLRGLLSSDEAQESCPFPSKDIAYCSQTPWIYEGTIRDNIIGQSELDHPWYQSVIRGCELDADMGRTPEGDAAEVGSRGSRLSGGQRQRIAIARALYSNKARMIFDDVTSALDGRTLSAVADKVFGRNGILRSKGTSVVLATHAVQILQLVDQVLLMDKDGKFIDSGTYEQLAERHQSFTQRQTLDSKPSAEAETSVLGKDVEATLEEYQTRLQTRVDDLRRQKGDWRSYAFYLGSMGWLNFIIFVLGAVFYVVFNAIFWVWLIWWAGDTNGGHGLGYWLGLYATWAMLVMLSLLLTPIFFFTKLASKASKVMHTELLAAAMRAPISSISSTEDIGSLVNRFSQDIRLCDWQLPFNILLTLFALLACLSSIGVAVAAVPYLAIAVPALAAILYLLQLLYLRTSRQLRLLEIELKAPIVSLFLDTIQGIATIHAFGWSRAYLQKSFSLLDSSQKPYYFLFCVQRWLILVLALIVTAIEVVVVGLAIALRTQASAGLVGLAVVQVMTLTRGLSELVMQWTEMETSLGAVSRTYRFTHETPREDHLGELTTALPAEWPSGGSISFEDVSATYDPSLALKNVTFSVKSGETVGICGRTGSGKSSLMAALLRLLPCHQGRILIDSIVISTMDPENIRSKLNCVTQEPFLVDGTIRENLSPWGDQVSDNDMVQALKQVDLWSKVVSVGGLDALLEDNSLSHGQRQLFCLARAFLRKSSILILDEPTGHIDPATDATIQRVIREGFPGRTIIMIAHRLQSLVEFDTVMVLESGCLIEIGPPKSLLSDSSSSFSALYHASESGS
ncbi:hypothetical protein DL771_002175 [Monosporascus sp. 5C6A]|nr:hypothetical protein DL771_002175 [Monosporascus sp. 5C6A]